MTMKVGSCNMNKDKLALMCLGLGEILKDVAGEEFEVTTCDVDLYFDEAANRANVTFSDNIEKETIKEALKEMCAC